MRTVSFFLKVSTKSSDNISHLKEDCPAISNFSLTNHSEKLRFIKNGWYLFVVFQFSKHGNNTMDIIEERKRRTA